MEKVKKTRSPKTRQNPAEDETSVSAPRTETKPETTRVRSARTPARKNVVPINLEEEIRRRAYELWEQRGRESGHEHEHWLIAESEVLSRYHGHRKQPA